MVFQVVAVGRVRHAGLRAACDDYAERAARYARLDVREVSVRQRGGAPDIVRKREAEALLRALPLDARGVAVTRRGPGTDSRDLARRLDRWQREARDVAFVLGGAYGLDTSVLERCEIHLSLSPMTLPHEIARLVLLEQLYRGHSICRGEPYHKGG